MSLKTILYLAKNLIVAVVICMAVYSSISFKGFTFSGLFMLFVGASYIFIPLMAFIRKRKVDVEADGIALITVLLFGTASYYYATGDFSLLFVAIIAYVILNMLLVVQIRRVREKTAGEGRRSIMLTLMSVLFVILILVTPFVVNSKVSFVRIAVYAVFMALPLYYFGKMLLLTKEEWKNVVAEDVLIGQSVSTALLILSIGGLDEVSDEMPGSLLPASLLIAVYAVDIIKSSTVNKN